MSIRRILSAQGRVDLVYIVTGTGGPTDELCRRAGADLSNSVVARDRFNSTDDSNVRDNAECFNRCWHVDKHQFRGLPGCLECGSTGCEWDYLQCTEGRA